MTNISCINQRRERVSSQSQCSRQCDRYNLQAKLIYSKTTSANTQMFLFNKIIAEFIRLNYIAPSTYNNQKKINLKLPVRRESELKKGKWEGGSSSGSGSLTRIGVIEGLICCFRCCWEKISRVVILTLLRVDDLIDFLKRKEQLGFLVNVWNLDDE